MKRAHGSESNILERSKKHFNAWRKVLKKLKRTFTNHDNLKVQFPYAYQREDVAQQGELTVGNYIYFSAQSYKQMKYSLRQLNRDIFDISSIKGQAL